MSTEKVMKGQRLTHLKLGQRRHGEAALVTNVVGPKLVRRQGG